MALRKNIIETTHPFLDKMEDAQCLNEDPELFFPNKGEAHKAKLAKKACLKCVVRDDCLDYALENGFNHGVWGGLTERERRKVKKGTAQRPARTSAA